MKLLIQLDPAAELQVFFDDNTTQLSVAGGAVRCNDPDRAVSAGLVPPNRVYLLREGSNVPLMGELRLKFRAT